MEFAKLLVTGSSPRGRGTRGSGRSRPDPSRFIPAWAGNTPPPPRASSAPPVHPRVGGEHASREHHGNRIHGSSPRGRGTRHAVAPLELNNRFIPAWAGNTRAATSGRIPAAVHPRVGGEHDPGARCPTFDAGSSPRGRGTRHGCRFRNTRFAVHPRVGGEHGDSGRTRDEIAGSSPRGRGTLADLNVGHELSRFIPAWAGNTSTSAAGFAPHAVHPRVGGEHHFALTARRPAVGSSPRGRGTPYDGHMENETPRFIPAWAGNTAHQPERIRLLPVHPRVGGEHSFWKHLIINNFQERRNLPASRWGRGSPAGFPAGYRKRYGCGRRGAGGAAALGTLPGLCLTSSRPGPRGRIRLRRSRGLRWRWVRRRRWRGCGRRCGGPPPPPSRCRRGRCRS